MKRNVFLGFVVLVIAPIPALGDYVYEGKWGSLGSREGQFNWPSGIALAPNGNLYVADRYNHRIQYFTWNGSFRGSWGTRGTGNGNFSHPEGVVVAPNGNVYVTEWYNNRVQYFTSSGSFLGKWGSYGNGQGQFNRPRGVVFLSTTSRVYVADWGNHRVQYFTPSGSFIGLWGSYGTGDGQFSNPGGVGVTTDGIIFIADTSNSRTQYSRWTEPAVAPSSVGRIKALFR